MTFSEAETAAIQDRAANEAGYLMESPYLLAMVTRAIHRLFTQRDDRGADYVIPVTTDLRTGQEPAQETFFNHVSYLFYRVPATAADDRAGLITLLKQQMYDQVKANFPRDLAQASLLTRIAPLPLLGKLLHLPMKGRMATFAFSHLGRSGYRHDCFFGARIRSLFHMPRVPLPPGIGFFSNSFQGKLTLVISHLDGLLAAEEIDLLERALRSGFAGEADA